MTTQVRQEIAQLSLQPLRYSVPIEFREDNGEGHARLKLSGEWTRIESMHNLWELDGEWTGAQPVIRMHFRIVTEDQRRLTVFQDLIEGTWYQQVSLGD